MKKLRDNKGLTPLPIVIGVSLVILAAVAYLVTVEKNPLSLINIFNPSPANEDAPETSNILSGNVSPNGIAEEKVEVKKEGEKITFSVKSDKKLWVSLINPSGETLEPEMISDTDYRINADEEGTWRIVLSNTGNNNAAYAVNIPSQFLNILDNTQGLVQNSSGVTISLNVEETVSGGTVRAVTGATVVANVIIPDQDTVSLNLTESEQGIYSGVFASTTEAGTYTVEYVISGYNSDGTLFEQITSGQFTVATSAEANVNYQWNKKFDINKGNQLQLIGY